VVGKRSKATSAGLSTEARTAYEAISRNSVRLSNTLLNVYCNDFHEIDD
jgi:hypothetical protein